MRSPQSHILCDHPATKAGRAKCRKVRAARSAALIAELDAVIDSYYTDHGSCEEIAEQLSALSAAAPKSESLRKAAYGYYSNDLEMEEIMGLAIAARLEILNRD